MNREIQIELDDDRWEEFGNISKVEKIPIEKLFGNILLAWQIRLDANVMNFGNPDYQDRLVFSQIEDDELTYRHHFYKEAEQKLYRKVKIKEKSGNPLESWEKGVLNKL